MVSVALRTTASTIAIPRLGTVAALYWPRTGEVNLAPHHRAPDTPTRWTSHHGSKGWMSPAIDRRPEG
jgi:hypothetical protein